MKKLLCIVLILCSFTSCRKWLDIAPKSEIASTKLFESEQGFKDALMGSYLLMSSQNAYGFESTVGFVDFLAQQYFMPGTTHPYYYASQYQYDHAAVIPKKDNIWLVSYNTIANLNNIIENIEQRKNNLHPAHYAFIKGESLGLRAFLHFDLFRLFGYGNMAMTPNGTKTALPYVTRYSKKLTPPASVAGYIDSLKNDLAAAAALLAPYDSIRITSNTRVEIPNSDLFYNNRNLRFNYYAVKATQARLYLWLGDYDKAIEAAGEVINKAKFLVNFHNGSINDPNPLLKDYTFSTEHIFALNVQNLYDIVRPFIQRYAADGFNINYSRFNHNGATADNLYEMATKPGMSTPDYRYKELYNKVSTSDYLLLKFTYAENSAYKDRMPLIKLPEMHYILAEAYNEKGDQANAVANLNTVRINRAIPTTFNLSSSLSKEAITEEIEKEYRKEFVSEGQLFYYYKRRGKTTIVGTSRAMDNTIYVLPLPQKEIDLGGR